LSCRGKFPPTGICLFVCQHRSQCRCVQLLCLQAIALDRDPFATYALAPAQCHEGTPPLEAGNTMGTSSTREASRSLDLLEIARFARDRSICSRSLDLLEIARFARDRSICRLIERFTGRETACLWGIRGTGATCAYCLLSRISAVTLSRKGPEQRSPDEHNKWGQTRQLPHHLTKPDVGIPQTKIEHLCLLCMRPECESVPSLSSGRIRPYVGGFPWKQGGRRARMSVPSHLV